MSRTAGLERVDSDIPASRLASRGDTEHSFTAADVRRAPPPTWKRIGWISYASESPMRAHGATRWRCARVDVNT